ncbi:hypothetical protein J1N35_010831, partial [Gossypium stocksii]
WSTTIPPTMTTRASTASNLEGFNQRMVEHLTASFELKSHIIALLLSKFKDIQQIRDRETTLYNELLA